MGACRVELAPRLPHIAQNPELRAVRSQQKHSVFHWLKAPADHPTYRALKPLLDAHAKQLAATAIDDGRRLRQ